MNTETRFILDESVRDPEASIWFAVPDGFTSLPHDALLPEVGTSAADALRSAVTPFLEAAPSDLIRARFVADYARAQQLLAALCVVGTVHCAVGLHRDDTGGGGTADSQMLFSFFTITWRDAAVAPRGVTAARAVTSAQGHTGVEYAELPCGPATFSESLLTPPAGSGLPRQALLQIHTHLPHPDCRRLAVLTLSTTAVARRRQYRAILRVIAQTVSFDNPLELGAESEHRTGTGRGQP
ncbi:hypothetical protein ABT301_30335 [Streptomyces sp. NPDC000987]|uniref:hypothetical protein n=1 Tax=Streptomyces sp. NPDC000987 TaxID=3154374 RepID=UPI0033201445